jgi:branched-chain amino acid aminotransferase
VPVVPSLREIEVTPVCEAGAYKFTPATISRAMIDDNSDGVQPKQKAA